MKPILLIGSSGYVGSAYEKYLHQNGLKYLVATRSNSNNFLAYVREIIEKYDVDFVLNAAGYTGKPNVDACEDHKGDCIDGNVIFPYKLAKLCYQKGIRMGHVSSGCIYTGSKGELGFTEEDIPNFSFKQNNCSFYSGTKALGEEVLAEFNNVYIWRLRIPFNNINSPRNYLTKVMTYPMLLEAENSISHLEEFVEATLFTSAVGMPGIYNITNTGSVTTSQVVELLKKYNLPGADHEFKFFKDEEEFMQIAAKTPRSNCVLDNTKLLNLGFYMTPAIEAVENSLKSWQV
ncbi:NAD-dependent epimerase/dehydratase family protein [bacterium]|nr:NAD-dependent epimerase/dehydratase family protein [bacterium]